MTQITQADIYANVREKAMGDARDALQACVAAYAIALKDDKALLPSPLMAALENARRVL